MAITIVAASRSGDNTTVFGKPSYVIKSPGELETYTFDFTNRLDGSTVSTATVTEQDTSVLTIATPSVATPNVTVAISGGVSGTDYVVVCKGTLADSDTPEVYLTVRVRNDV